MGQWMRVNYGLMIFLPFAIGSAMLWKAWPMFTEYPISQVLYGTEWMPLKGKFGMWPFISSSLIIAALGTVMMVPLCLCAAIYIAEFSSKKISDSLQAIIDTLAGIPSVIFGLWGVVAIVPFVSSIAEGAGAANTSGYSILAAGVVMCVSTSPYVLNMLLEQFRSAEQELKDAALSLGASRWQMIRDVMLRRLFPGIMAAFTLGISKAFGETIAILMVVGNVVQVPGGFFDAGYPLPALIANNYGEMMSIPMYDAALMFSAFLLLMIVMAFNLLAHRVIHFYLAKSS